MEKTKKILACIDFSKHSKKTMDHALGLARARKAKVVAYHVVHHRDVHPVYLHETWFGFRQSAGRDVKAYARERADQMQQWLVTHFPDHAQTVEVRVESGEPGTAIVRAAKDLGADLVVMAYKGRARLSRLFFGSTCTRVFGTSCVPVVRLGV